MDSWILKTIEKAVEDEALRRAHEALSSVGFRFRGYNAEQITLLILNFESKYTVADSSLSVIDMQRLLNR